jgi:predicted nucleotidyltransferase
MAIEEALGNTLVKHLGQCCDFFIVFGSASAGRLTDESDIDVGIFLSKDADFDRNRILQALSQELDRDVDLVVLNSADPIICMEILRTGDVVFKKSQNSYISFVAQKLSEYWDFVRSREVVERNLLSRTIFGVK